MVETSEQHPRTRYLGLAIALLLSAAVIACLVIIASGLRDEETEAADVAELVEAIAAESGAVTDGYLASPESAAQLISRSLGDDRAVPTTELISLLGHLTATHDNVVGAFVGYPDGSFLDVRQDESSAEGGYRMKHITISPTGERRVLLTKTDSLLNPTLTSTDPEDKYDPRVRPWYQGLEGGSTYWTDPYVFFTSQQPGITHSVAVTDDSGVIEAVVGIDVRLADLNAFLADRTTSTNGSAVVIDGTGQIIAGSHTTAADGAEITVDSDVARMLAAVPELTLNETGAAPWVNRWTEGEPHVLATQPVGENGDWLLVVEAPEDDFLQDIRTSRRRYAIIATSVGALSTLLFLIAAVWVTRHIEKLRKLARTDQLSGLLNRATARDELDHLLDRHDRSDIATMILDLDDFKVINDQFGHDAGDTVLRTITDRLRSAADDTAILGRLGGDEFLVVVQKTEETRNVEAQLEQIVRYLKDPIEAGGFELDVHMSAGYSVVLPSEEKTSGEVLTEADTALYDAKAVFATTLMPFDESMKMRSARDFLRKSELQEAISNGEFILHYQPEFDLITNTVIGAEALLRWDHPHEGIMAAGVFIEDLERFDLIGELLQLLVEQSTSFVRELPDCRFIMRINVSAEQLLDPTLIPLITDAVRKTPSVQWCIEVTERTVVEASNVMVSSLRKLRDLGVEIALDDFGTGYSSLQELQQLPVDAIKIDRVFIEKLEDCDPRDSIAAILVDLASHMKVDVVAEGIETEVQRDAVEAIGCVRAQGFYLAMPASAVDFHENWTSHLHEATAKAA